AALDGSDASELDDPRLVSDRRRLVVLDALELLLAGRPLALVLDDAQWIDRSSLDAIGALLARSGSKSLLVAVASRQEPTDDAPGWLRDADVWRIRPRPLRRTEVRDLITPILGAERAGELAPTVHEHAEGNPF